MATKQHGSTWCLCFLVKHVGRNEASLAAAKILAPSPRVNRVNCEFRSSLITSNHLKHTNSGIKIKAQSWHDWTLYATSTRSPAVEIVMNVYPFSTAASVAAPSSSTLPSESTAKADSTPKSARLSYKVKNHSSSFGQPTGAEGERNRKEKKREDWREARHSESIRRHSSHSRRHGHPSRPRGSHHRDEDDGEVDGDSSRTRRRDRPSKRSSRSDSPKTASHHPSNANDHGDNLLAAERAEHDARAAQEWREKIRDLGGMTDGGDESVFGGTSGDAFTRFQSDFDREVAYERERLAFEAGSDSTPQQQGQRIFRNATQTHWARRVDRTSHVRR